MADKKNKLDKREAKLKKLREELDQADRDLERMKKNSSKRPGGKKNDDKKSSRLALAIVITIVILVMFFGAQNIFSSVNSTFTDTLTTSEFIQAVEADRVQSVTYDAGSYSVSGDYTATDDKLSQLTEEGVDVNEVSQLLSEVQGQDNSDPHNRAYTATFIGQDSLLQLMQKHPNIEYRIKLPASGAT